MRKILYLIICMPLLLFSACDVHEWPETQEFVKMHLRLNYETDMTEWEHIYDGTSVIEQGLGDTYDNHQDYGKIRYIVRTYPVSDKQRTMQDYVQEFVFTKDIAEGYDHEVTLDVLPGNYNVMVWSDDNFAEIMLQGDHKGNTNHRDAFRGTNNISLIADVMERLPDTLNVAMQRPLAKFEFVTNDVVEFIDKESTRIASKANGNKSASADDTPTRAVNIEDYKVMFESTLKKLSDSEASMGFDYVFVNGKKSAVTVQIGIYDNEGTQLSLTEPIEVPLKRSHHTIMTGMFLMSEASGGVTINPDFDGAN